MIFGLDCVSSKWEIAMVLDTGKSKKRESEKLRILVAEDEESFLRVLVSILESAKRFTVYPCESGEEALEVYRRSHFDMIILDQKMPGMSGLNVLQWLNEQKSTTPVIMLTGAGSEHIAVEAMKLGAYDYLRKDHFDRDHFLIIVNGVYERYLFKREKELHEINARQHERDLASLQLLQESVSSFAQIAATTLTLVALLTEESEHNLVPLILPEGKEIFASHIRRIREQHEALLSMCKSMASLSTQLSQSRTEKRHEHQPKKAPASSAKQPHDRNSGD
jgi:DNA-binding response OmpR family regulator